MKTNKTAPDTTLEAYGQVMDLFEAVGALRVAAMSQVHPLTLPSEAITKLVEAQQALMAAHRIIEAAVMTKVGS